MNEILQVCFLAAFIGVDRCDCEAVMGWAEDARFLADQAARVGAQGRDAVAVRILERAAEFCQEQAKKRDTHDDAA